MDAAAPASDRRWRQQSPTTPGPAGGGRRTTTTPNVEAATTEANDGNLRTAKAVTGPGRERDGVRVPQVLWTDHAAIDTETEIVTATATEAGTGAVTVIGGDDALAGTENPTAEDVIQTMVLTTTTTRRGIGRAW